MINKEEAEKIKSLLNKCDNIEEMFDMLSNHYDLKNCKPSAITKPLFIKGVIQGLTMLNPKKL